MYAIIRTGGKQYKVAAGDVVRVEKLEKDLGAEFDLTDVLLVGGEKTHVGQPTVKNAKVTVVVTRQDKDKKVIIFKKKRRQGYRRLKGFRQPFTELFVKSITSPDGVAKADSEPVIVDMAQKRADKLAEKLEAKQEARNNKADSSETTETTKKVAKKKVAKKATAKKPAKKKAGAKKAGAKKKTAKKAKK